MNDLAMMQLVLIIDVIPRGDWDWEGECSIFGYLTNRVHVSTAGKGLGNLAGPTLHRGPILCEVLCRFYN